jgi:hypothetical protein
MNVSNGLCADKYEDILAILNLSTFHSRGQNLDALFIINVFKIKLVGVTF